MHISYGDNGIDLDIPEENIAEVIVPEATSESDDIAGMLDKAVKESVTDLTEFTCNKRVNLLIADHTRGQPHVEMMEASFNNMKEAAFVRVI
ncbi:MAG: lactate racemase domain-containing protein, partial [Planctomycetota bacterium]